MYYILLHSQSCHKSLISIERYYSRLFVLEFKAPSIVQVQQSHYILSVRFLLILILIFFHLLIHSLVYSKQDIPLSGINLELSDCAWIFLKNGAIIICMFSVGSTYLLLIVSCERKHAVHLFTCLSVVLYLDFVVTTESLTLLIDHHIGVDLIYLLRFHFYVVTLWVYKHGILSICFLLYCGKRWVHTLFSQGIIVILVFFFFKIAIFKNIGICT